MLKRMAFILCFFVGTLFTITAIAQEHTDNNDSYSPTSDYVDEYDDDIDYSTKSNFTLESGESLPRSETSTLFYAEIEKVLAGVDFAQREKVTRRRVKDVTDEETRESKFPQWIIDLVKAVEGMDGGLAIFATILEVLVWTLAVGLILFLLIKYQTQLRDWATGIGSKESEPELPTSLFGLDIKKESIPEDVVTTARSHWLNGEKRLAVAVLLRSSLIKLLHEYGCRFFGSDTESECCERIDQQVEQGISVYMRMLVSAWQRIAYAHIDPSDQQFEQLCRQWREVF